MRRPSHISSPKGSKPDLDPSAQEAAQAKLLASLVKQLNTSMEHGGGTLNVLRKGFKDVNATFSMVQDRPTETDNPELMDRYAQNRLRVMRQVRYSTHWPHRSIDLVLFCNGLPVATIELKTDFTQSVTQGKVQYAESRQPTDPGTDGKEPLLTWGARAVVHFVVTNSVVAMTTELDGKNTVFLPFNLGHDDGAGNPPDPDGQTTYFWRDVLQRDLWLTILTKFMLVKVDKGTDPATGKPKKSVSVRFPRHHQLAAVEKIVAHTKQHGTGQRYLIEHSAGSGKTDSIVWTAHRLAALHDDHNTKVFDSVIVVSDRTVLDRQISAAMVQLDPAKAMVAKIDGVGSSKSKHFAEVIAKHTPIVIVTVQTAPFVLDYLRKETSKLRGRFAVIADEAHSSQSGDAASKMRTLLEPEDLAALEASGTVSTEAILTGDMKQRGTAPNISFFTFTATPKYTTMELFGTPVGDGYVPFHRYTMKQAVEEGFILDVLTNYTSYKVAFKIAMGGQEYDSEEFDQARAVKSALNWVKLHEYNISQKVDTIIKHFRTTVAGMLDGHAKAMVVTSSRREALRYHKAIEAHIAENGYRNLRSLCAFSEKAFDPDLAPDGITEAELNDLQGRPLEDVFKGNPFAIMIVANKFQVGFDQPLLCAMYVDKRLDGVMAVQTLSRLNRTYPGKTDVYVMDFFNNPEDILAAFLPYYRGAELPTSTDQNIPHQIAAKLDQFNLYTHEEVNEAAEYLVARKNVKSAGVLSKVVDRFTTAHDQAVLNDDTGRLEELAMFRSEVNNYTKAYAFLSQIVDYEDPMMEKRYLFYKALAQLIHVEGTGVKINLDRLTLTHHKLIDKGTQELNLALGEPTPLTAMTMVGTAELHDPKNALWKEILAIINDLFAGTELSERDKILQTDLFFKGVKLQPGLTEAAKANNDADFYNADIVTDAFLEALLKMRSTNQDFTDALLQDQNSHTLKALVRKLNLRAWLAEEPLAS